MKSAISVKAGAISTVLTAATANGMISSAMVQGGLMQLAKQRARHAKRSTWNVGMIMHHAEYG